MTQLSKQDIIDIDTAILSKAPVTNLKQIVKVWDGFHAFNTAYQKRIRAHNYITSAYGSKGTGKFLNVFNKPEEMKIQKRENNISEKERKIEGKMDITSAQIQMLNNLFEMEGDIIDDLIFVLFATGRRVSEIVESEFEELDEYTLLTYELKKSRKGERADIKTLFEASDLLDRIENIQNANKSVNWWTTQGNVRVKKLLESKDITLHTLRAIYAHLGGITLEEKQKILNHKNIKSTQHYNHINIK